MTLSWDAARQHLHDTLDQLPTSDPEGEVSEALTVYEWPPTYANARLPFAIIIPPPREVTRSTGHVREVNFNGGIDVAIALAAGNGDSSRLDRMAQRYESWIETLMDTYDLKLSWDHTITVMNRQRFSPLQRLPLVADGYIGFVMSFDVRLKTTATLGA